MSHSSHRPSRSLPSLALVAAWALTATACFSHGTAHTAAPIESGASQISLGGGVVGARGGQGGTNASDRVPTAHYQNRIGLTESMDFGLRLKGLGVALDVNYAVLQRPDFVLSLDPELSVLANQPSQRGRFTSTGSPLITNRFSFRFNVLADVVKTDNFDLTLKAAPEYALATGTNFLSGTGPGIGGGAFARYTLPSGMGRGSIPFIFGTADTFLPLTPSSLSNGAWGYSLVGGIGMKM